MIDHARTRRLLAEHAQRRAPEPEPSDPPDGTEPPEEPEAPAGTAEPIDSRTASRTEFEAELRRRGIHIHSRGL